MLDSNTSYLSLPLQVTISSPRKRIFQGIANSISSRNSAGKFDVLPGHGNFITFIQNQPIIIRQADKPPLNFTFPMAIIYVRNNKVGIYTDINVELLTSE